MAIKIAQDDNNIDDVEDDAAADSSVAIEKYAISSFGIDFDVEGLVRRLKKREIYVPDFQRNFVWSHRESSQFVESLLLGLPVPGVLLAKDRHTQKLMIIDGQQRLKSLQFFYDGYFKPEAKKKHQQVFDLIQVQPQFAGKTYDGLEEDDQRRLDNSVIHATIIKQESPDEEEDSSLYYVFGRLNSGGRRVTRRVGPCRPLRLEADARGTSTMGQGLFPRAIANLRRPPRESGRTSPLGFW